ncbi:Cysteine-rich receptor-like protein kinase 10 [Hordeum vulgare]|nr:Cysteine-rich receptor-like protein kinase 10 [Hordeum vulgare]
MATDDNEATVKWAREYYVQGEMKRQRGALEEISARRCGREEGGGVILDESDEEASAPVRLGNPGPRSSKDGAPAGGNGDDGDYIAFYKLLRM